MFHFFRVQSWFIYNYEISFIFSFKVWVTHFEVSRKVKDSSISKDFIDWRGKRRFLGVKPSRTSRVQEMYGYFSNISGINSLGP